MSTRQHVLNTDQKNFIAEMAATYGIDPDEIMFFSDTDKPFFGYEATCILCDRLAELPAIDLNPVDSILPDSLSVKCSITLADGRVRSGLGMVNLGETLDDKPLSATQLLATASARAIRSALRSAAIDLFRLHRESKRGPGGIEYSGPPITERQRLIREVHALGYETGYIFDVSHDGGAKVPDKTGWRRILETRYHTDSSADMTDADLADLASFLRSQRPRFDRAA